MNVEPTMNAEAEARQARFGRLPRRIRFENMSEGVEVTPSGVGNASHNPEKSWTYHSCLALDLGL
ncbi:hypothetical protein [Embleya hyalina]|uniref:Uncharacterized protein n=1 Tax=Embleya hyalina TaxID=516124 RepID=A0A401YSU3_9ACTN|nr:hypothetical protein [Embleya hyalina]GCD97673.1 hypothetical protein EHYA_05369 [Embleya hyalina]